MKIVCKNNNLLLFILKVILIIRTTEGEVDFNIKINTKNDLVPIDETIINIEQVEDSHSFNEGSVLISSDTQISFYDCTDPKHLDAYSLSNVDSCNIQDSDLVRQDSHVLLWKKEYATKHIAYSCILTYTLERWFCSSEDGDSHIETTYNEPNMVYKLTKEQCKDAIPKSGTNSSVVIISDLWGLTQFPIKFILNGTALTTVNLGKESDTNHTNSNPSWVNKFSFSATLLQEEIDYDKKSKEVSNAEGMVLQANIEDGGQGSTNHMKKAYAWNPKDGYTTELVTYAHVNVINWVAKGKVYVINDQFDKIYNTPEFKMEVLREKEHLSITRPDFGRTKITENKNEDLFVNSFLPSDFIVGNNVIAYQTSNDDIYVTFLLGGFHMDNRHLLKKDEGYESLKNIYCNEMGFKFCDYVSLVNLTNLVAEKQILSRHIKRLDDMGIYKPSIKTDLMNAIKIVEELNSTIGWIKDIDMKVENISIAKNNTDSIERNSLYSKLLNLEKIKQIDLVKMECEIYSQKLLTIWQLAQIDSRKAGKMLTEKNDHFFDIKDNFGWLYQCDHRRAPVVQQKQCYDKIPIVYDGVVQFVDQYTRKLADPLLVREISREEAKRTLFQLDEQDPNSWFTLNPRFVKHESAITKNIVQSSKGQGLSLRKSMISDLYSQEDIHNFYNQLEIDKRRNALLEEMLNKIQLKVDGMIKWRDGLFWSNHIKKHFFVDNLISSAYFATNFAEKIYSFLGYTSAVIIKCGGYFGFLWFLFYLTAISKFSLRCYHSIKSLYKAKLYESKVKMIYSACIGSVHSHDLIDKLERDYILTRRSNDSTQGDIKNIPPPPNFCIGDRMIRPYKFESEYKALEKLSRESQLECFHQYNEYYRKTTDDPSLNTSSIEEFRRRVFLNEPLCPKLISNYSTDNFHMVKETNLDDSPENANYLAMQKPIDQSIEKSENSTVGTDNNLSVEQKEKDHDENHHDD